MNLNFYGLVNRLIRLHPFSRNNYLNVLSFGTRAKKDPEAKLAAKKSHVDEIKTYLSKKDKSLCGLIPVKYFRLKSSRHSYTFLVDDDVAKKFVDLIIEDLLQGECVIIEGNPGLGKITKYLLEGGVNKLKLFDDSSVLLVPLQRIILDNAEKLEVIQGDVFNLSKYSYQDLMDQGSRMKEMFKDVKNKKWTDEPAIKIVGNVTNYTFFQQWIMALVNSEQYTSYGRIRCFITIPSFQFNMLVRPEKGYWSNKKMYLLFSWFFEAEILGKFLKKDFVPWMQEFKRAKMFPDHDYLYLVRIESKRDLFDDVVNKNNLKELFYFVQFFCSNQNNKIIHFLEKWIPDIGPLLISQGLTIYTEVRDLTSDEMLKIFQIFISRPNYNRSEFLHVMESVQVTRNRPNTEDPIDKEMKDLEKCVNINRR